MSVYVCVGVGVGVGVCVWTLCVLGGVHGDEDHVGWPPVVRQEAPVIPRRALRLLGHTVGVFGGPTAIDLR